MDEGNGIERLDPLLTALADEVALRVRRRQRRRALGKGVFTLAAATVVGGLIFVSVGRPGVPDAPPDVGLNVSSSRPFAVFPTSRDDITVIWLMDEER